MHHSFLNNFLAFLAAAVIAVPLFQRLGLGSVLGYLAAGSLIGPWGFRLFTDVPSIMSFAELGVVLLLFVIGLELKPNRLWRMRKAVFVMGSVQLVSTTLLLAGIAYLFGIPTWAAGLAGLGLALSSTAFALQILAEKNQVNTSHGRVSFAILLFQDIAVIPVLAIVPLLGSSSSLSQGLWIAMGKAVGAILAIVIGGRYLIRPAFRLVASVRSKEVFTAATLLLVLGIALLMETISLSMALGTFLAGVLLADSEFRHEIEADIDPFKGLLLGLFFMAVGMGVDYALVLQNPLLVLAVVLGFMFLKVVLLFLVGKLAGLSSDGARNMAFVLPQGGEFAFVLFEVAARSQVMSSSLAGLLVVAVTLSMALTPLLVFFNERFFCSQSNKKQEAEFDKLPAVDSSVIVAGYGRFGQIVSRILRVQEIPVTALELDPDQVQVVRRFGLEIYYGDASRVDLLETAGAGKARAFVLAIDDVDASIRTAEAVRSRFPNLKIFARARNRLHAHELMNLGVELITRETFASSLEVAHQVLRELGYATADADEVIRKFREHDEKMLVEQKPFAKDEKQLIAFSKQSTQLLADLFRKDKS